MIELKKGDFFATRNPQALGRGINAVQTWWAKDGKAVYSHTGLIVDDKGTTFEALWTIKRQNLYEAYEGEKVCIARWEGMTDTLSYAALNLLSKRHEGRVYPGWRIFLNMVPPIARYINWKGRFCVCSELTAKFLYIVYALGGYLDDHYYAWPRHSHYCGTNPDMLVDEWHRWRGYQIVFEGTLKKDVHR